MKRIQKISLFLVAVICAILIGLYFFRMNHSRQTAFEIVRENCLHQSLDINRLVGPRNETVGKATVSYSWDYKDEKHHYQFLVWFDFFYQPEIAVWDYDRKD
jgi:hypothetical protein